MTPLEKLQQLVKNRTTSFYEGIMEIEVEGLTLKGANDIVIEAFNLGIETCAENAKIITVVDPYSGPQEYLDRETVNKLKI